MNTTKVIVPFNKPFWGKEEERAVVNALRKTIGTGDGPNTAFVTDQLRKLTGASYVLPVTSCTHGLELAMAAYGIGQGDEVIMPSFTMTSTANAVVLFGGTPVFADIDPTYFCLDPDDVERRITRKTRGMIIVHYAGMACQMERLRDIAKKKKLFIVEDAAHTIGAYYQGSMMGNIADIGIFSFHGTKNISCGEGGAVLTNSKALFGKMEVYRANGTNRNAFIRGDVAKYSWVSGGSSYFLSDILAAVLGEQLKKIARITKTRNAIAREYTRGLQPFSSFLQLPSVPEGTKPNWHIYAVKFRKAEHRDSFIQMMRAAGVEVTSHYVPLHSSTFGRKLSGSVTKLPVTDEVSRTIVRLPVYPGLTKKQIRYVIQCAKKTIRSMQY